MSRNGHPVAVVHLAIWLSSAFTILMPGLTIAETPPDIQAVPKDRFLEAKLGQAKLGELSRLKRDYAEAQHDLESAEVETAVAAVEAEHAKDEAIKALAHDVHLQEQISNSESAASVPGPSTISTRKQSDSSNTSSNQNNDSEEYEDENEAEQTIIEDTGGNITATFISVENDEASSKSKSGSQKANESVSGVTGISCQKVIDLVTITNDFRKQLQQLLDREQQSINQLVQLYSSMKPMFQNLQSMTQTRYDTNNGQPSRACVYISEHLNKKEAIPIDSAAPKDEGPRDGNGHGKLHIYTDKGILPQSNTKALGNNYSNMPNMGSQSEAVPVLQGHIRPEGSSNEKQSTLEGQFTTNERRTTRDNAGNQASGHSGDIDLEQIYWIKPDDALSAPSGKDVPPVYNAVMKRIIGQGKDVLIIPISSTLKDVRQVSDSFLKAVKTRRDARATGRKLKMKILRVK